MQFEGPGDTGIHNTQLAVTASLLRAGVTVDCVVDDVTAATQRAVAGDPRAAAWDWKAERWVVPMDGLRFRQQAPRAHRLAARPSAAVLAQAGESRRRRPHQGRVVGIPPHMVCQEPQAKDWRGRCRSPR